MLELLKFFILLNQQNNNNSSNSLILPKLDTNCNTLNYDSNINMDNQNQLISKKSSLININNNSFKDNNINNNNYNNNGNTIISKSLNNPSNKVANSSCNIFNSNYNIFVNNKQENQSNTASKYAFSNSIDYIGYFNVDNVLKEINQLKQSYFSSNYNDNDNDNSNLLPNSLINQFFSKENVINNIANNKANINNDKNNKHSKINKNNKINNINVYNIDKDKNKVKKTYKKRIIFKHIYIGPNEKINNKIVNNNNYNNHINNDTYKNIKEIINCVNDNNIYYNNNNIYYNNNNNINNNYIKKIKLIGIEKQCFNKKLRCLFNNYVFNKINIILKEMKTNKCIISLTTKYSNCLTNKFVRKYMQSTIKDVYCNMSEVCIYDERCKNNKITLDFAANCNNELKTFINKTFCEVYSEYLQSVEYLDSLKNIKDIKGNLYLVKYIQVAEDFLKSYGLE